MSRQPNTAPGDTPDARQPGADPTQAIIGLMNPFSIEITPRGAAKIPDFREHLKPGTRVYVTALPGSDFNETLSTCKRLSDEGMQPVPHFTARSIPDQQTLRDYLDRATSEAGVTAVLALGGADREAAGEFEDSAALLETGLFDRFGIKSIGIAGHPEGSPDIERLFLREYGQRKIRYAELTGADMYMITQFVFEAQPIIDWIERVREEGNQLPLVVGIPGPASLKSLIGHAANCGVGPSITFLTKQAKQVHKLLLLQTPDKLVRDLAQYASTQPQANISGIHLFTLGAFPVTAQWAADVAAGRFELTENGISV
ncbi:MAG: methylenetetrahydrofolate reductase [Thiothrix sp.]|nr:methylenetetrahydrofolate reductase [Thiothrix sp.]HPQ96067.1 methylenetetrahydrofolate reductase [Thiolinea sp.]